MYGVMTLDEVSLLCYQMTTNNAINKNIASVINSWSNSSKCLWTNKVIYIYMFLHDQMNYQCLHYKAITSQNVLSKAKIKNFFIS